MRNIFLDKTTPGNEFSVLGLFLLRDLLRDGVSSTIGWKIAKRGIVQKSMKTHPVRWVSYFNTGKTKRNIFFPPVLFFYIIIFRKRSFVFFFVNFRIFQRLIVICAFLLLEKEEKKNDFPHANTANINVWEKRPEAGMSGTFQFYFSNLPVFDTEILPI